MNLKKILEEPKNIAKLLDAETLKDIGHSVVSGFDEDEMSCSGWKKDVKEYVKLALQVCEEKSFPWPDASNVKYPLISIAALQFNARAYPSLVPQDGKVVSCGAYGADLKGEKQARARRVSQYMSYQVMHEMDHWEDHMDNLLSILPIFGIAIKKTYFNSKKKANESTLIHPFNFVVNYWTQELDDCPRSTEIIYRNERQIIENTRKGLYLDVDLGAPHITKNVREEINVSKNLSETSTEEREFTPYMLLEQHTYLDLDKDGYSEPYVVLVDYNSNQVLRITPRFTEEDVEFTKDGKVSEITVTSHYTKFPFIPSADGSFYTRGFGHLLGPINEAMNTIVNQLIDAGSLSNMQAGFIGKGLKIRQGDVRFRPGEWKPVNSLGADIKANIFPLPVREPSSVLFQLLGMLTQSGKELASVAEIMTGKMPGQNTPAYTTQATIEQGMKVFTAVYKRVYRAMTEEFKKLYNLNTRYLDEQDYQNVLDDPLATKKDFEYKDKDICPSADPSASSDTEKLQKYQTTGSLLQLGTINPIWYTQKTMAAMGFTDSEVQQAMEGSKATQPPQPDPEMQKMQAEGKMKQQESQMKMQIEQTKAALKAKEMEFKMAMAQQEKTMGMKLTAQAEMMKQQFEAIKSQLNLRAEAEKHQQQMQQSQEVHAEKVKQARAAPNKPKKGD